MEKKFERAQGGQYSGDGVIGRGYEIYDEWKRKKFTSRKIVGSVENAAASVRKNGTNRAYIEALSYLFALDMRIKEKYHHFLLCLFLYFFWRNEMRALKLLKDVCHISGKHGDVRTAIEVALQKLREKADTEEAEGEDDDVRGGKRNGKAEKEAKTAREKQQDQAKEEAQKDAQEETPEESADKEETKETSEEKAEEITEQTPTEEKEALAEQKESPQKEAENMVRGEKEQGKQEKQTENKTENNGIGENSEPSTDKKREAKTYNDALDPPLPYDFSEKSSHSKPAEKASSDDAFYLDQMFLKEKNESVSEKSTQDVQRGKENMQTKEGEKAARQNTETKTDGKESHLYDKTTPATEKGITSPQQKTAVDTKAPQTTAQTANANEIAEINDSFEDLSAPVDMDISLDQENAMRQAISRSISEDPNTILAIRNQMMAVAREQMEIADADLGMNGPTEIVGKTETVNTKQVNFAQERK